MPRREVPCVLVGHKVTEVQESLEDLQLSADAFFIYTFFRQFLCFLFLVEELVINIWPWWQETQMILNAMNVGTSISQRVSGQTVSRDSLGIALNLYRRSLTFDVCSVVMCCDVLCPSNEHSIVTVSEGEGVLIRLNGSLPHSKKSWWHLVLHAFAVCCLHWVHLGASCTERKELKWHRLWSQLYLSTSQPKSVGLVTWNVSFHTFQYVSDMFHRFFFTMGEAVTLFWHRICACSHFAASSQRKLTKQAGCQLPSHRWRLAPCQKCCGNFYWPEQIFAPWSTFTFGVCTLGKDFQDKSFSGWRPSLSAIASSPTSWCWDIKLTAYDENGTIFAAQIDYGSWGCKIVYACFLCLCK